jgi:mannose/cellobiose epimerase-like protein (N-acyl-D-glucosamine 2-epimerase family)
LTTLVRNFVADLASLRSRQAIERISAAITPETLAQLASTLETELRENVVNFWLPRCLDEKHGGYLVDFDSTGRFVELDRKALVVQARMLWFLSRLISEKIETPVASAAVLRRAADMGFRFLQERMWDQTHGGFFWEVNRAGTEKKRIAKDAYGQGFALFALSQYYLAVGSAAAKDLADNLFQVLERNMHDDEHGGYIEYLESDWRPPPKGAPRYSHPTPAHLKTANTHLHLLEALTPYVVADPALLARVRLIELIQIQTTTIMRKQNASSYECFDRNWIQAASNRNELTSFGHDLENISLLIEACAAAKIPESPFHGLFRAVFDQVSRHGVDWKVGGVYLYGTVGKPAHHRDKLWWVQAEALLGAMHIYRRFRDRNALAVLLLTWRFIEEALIDHTHGEWFERIRSDGSSLRHKGDEWKTAYHNGRALLGCSKMLRSCDNREKAL